MYLTRSGAETEGLGERLGHELAPGDVVLLSGELGAGKTTFARGVCRALGVRGPVTSPTFTIGRAYEGRREGGESQVITHLDLYRLAGLEDEDPGLIEDYLGPENVVLLEWPEVAEAPLSDRVTRRIQIEHAGDDNRRISMTR